MGGCLYDLAHNVEAAQGVGARHCYLAPAMHNRTHVSPMRSSQSITMIKLSMAVAAATLRTSRLSRP